MPKPAKVRIKQRISRLSSSLLKFNSLTMMHTWSGRSVSLPASVLLLFKSMDARSVRHSLYNKK